MNNFKKIFPFLIPYKKYAYLNIFFNVLYALFGTLSFVALIPMMQVLFDLAKKNTIKPIYLGWIEKGDLFENISLYFSNSKSFLEDSLSYFLTTSTENFGIDYTLSLMVALIISIFLIKNLCDYLALYFITFLRNGILKDMRDAMYKKTIDLPFRFSEKNARGKSIVFLYMASRISFKIPFRKKVIKYSAK